MCTVFPDDIFDFIHIYVYVYVYIYIYVDKTLESYKPFRHQFELNIGN